LGGIPLMMENMSGNPIVLENIVSKELIVVILLLLLAFIVYFYFSTRKKGNRKSDFPFYDIESEYIAKSIAELKWKYNIEELLPEHLLYSIVDKPGKVLHKILSKQRIEIEGIKEDLTCLFEKRDSKEKEKIFIGKYLEVIIDNINKRNYSRISPTLMFESLLVKIVNTNDSVYDNSRNIFQKNNVSPDKLLLEIQNYLDKIEL
jgi:ATP-dependent Clp protease ATP-binding subunit ClpA